MRAMFVLFSAVLLLFLSGCSIGVNACVDDGYCSTRELQSTSICNDCINGPFIPESIVGLNHYSQPDIEAQYTEQLAKDMASNYIGVANPLYVLYADKITDVLDQYATKTSIILAQHSSENMKQQTINSLLTDRYDMFNWSLTSHDGLVYYYAKREGSLTEELVIFSAGLDVYFLISENNPNSSAIVERYLEKYGADKVVEETLLNDTLSPKLELPKDVIVAVSNISINDSDDNSSVYRVLLIEPSEALTNVRLEFQLPKEWVDSRVQNSSLISTFLSDGGTTWEDIGAMYLGESRDFYHYQTIIPHFSMIVMGLISTELPEEPISCTNLPEGAIACNDEAIVFDTNYMVVTGGTCGDLKKTLTDFACLATCPDDQIIVDGTCEDISVCAPPLEWELCGVHEKQEFDDQDNYFAIKDSYTYIVNGECPRSINYRDVSILRCNLTSGGSCNYATKIAPTCYVFCPSDKEVTFASNGDLECTSVDSVCGDETAINYGGSAILDDGSNIDNSFCEYEDDYVGEDVYGCMEPSADNYDEYANVDDDSCTYDSYYDDGFNDDPQSGDYDCSADGTC